MGAEEAERTFALLAAGGQIFMPLAETFFARRFAMLRDRFGTSWMSLHEWAATRANEAASQKQDQGTVWDSLESFRVLVRSPAVQTHWKIPLQSTPVWGRGSFTHTRSTEAAHDRPALPARLKLK